MRRHQLELEVASEYLRQRGRRSSCRTVKLLNDILYSSVDIQELRVDCCRKGWVACMAARKILTAFDVYLPARHQAGGTPAKKVGHWRLVSWLRMFLADPSIDPWMVRVVACSREASNSYGPVYGVRDFFDGDIFRDMCADGQMNSNTIALLVL